jgi:hypothetical protein
VTITCGSDVTGFDAVRVGRGMPRAPVPFCGCGGTPHGRGSFAERTVSGGRLSGRGKRGSKTNRCRNKGAFIYTMYKKGGVGTWWRRNLSGTVSVTWRSVPGGCRRRARLVLTVLPGRCWLFLFRRTWTLLPISGREKGGCKESGMAGVPSQREGTGQEERRKREGRGSLAMGGNGPGRKEKAGRPGFPRNGRERARKKGRKRESRGSLAMGGNGPGRNGESGKAGVPSQWEGTGQEELESGKAGVPSQWEGTGQEELEKAGKPGFPRNGRERARKKGESGWSARSEAESESVRELD